MKQQFNKNKPNLIDSKRIRVVKHRDVEDIIATMRIIDSQLQCETVSIVEHPYPMRIRTIADHKGLWWVAEYIDLPGVCGTARTREEAVHDLQMNARVHIEVSLKMGLTVDSKFLTEEWIDDNQRV